MFHQELSVEDVKKCEILMLTHFQNTYLIQTKIIQKLYIENISV